MKYSKCLLVLGVLTLFVHVNAFCQGQSQEAPPPERGMVELGVRQVSGDVYGRPDLPFDPNVTTSKFNEYRDIRNGFFVPRFRFQAPDLAGSGRYVDFQSQRAVFKDQSYLVTFGRWGKYKLQFRYDEIPHIYSNTTRTAYVSTTPGVLTISPTLRTALQAINTSTVLPSTMQFQTVPGLSFITPSILRRDGTASFQVTPSPTWGFFVNYFREHQTGTRPMSLIFNSSPSAALSGGFGVELPEPIDYFNNTLSTGIEFGHQKWAFQFGYLGSFFVNNIGSLTFDNPFRTTACVAPTGCTAAAAGPDTGRIDLWPDNSANYLNFSGAVGLGNLARLMASITPGWLRQKDAFLPYTSNALIEATTAPLPATNLDGSKQTLAMNYRIATTKWKHVEVDASYRQYDYNNNTPSRTFTPVQGDIATPTPDDNTPFGYNRKTLEVFGNLLFGKKSSIKAGYIGEWMDRTNRDVEHSKENGFRTAIDWVPIKDLSLRIGYQYSKRDPEAYVDDAATTVSGGITDDQVFSRRFDESARQRYRGDASLEYTPTDRLTLSAFGGTLQDNYNLPGNTNSPTPLNFLPGASLNYYLYGLLKDISYNYGFDVDFAVTSAASFFGEYSHEKYTKRMASRYRAPGSTVLANTCGAGAACDTPNNDWGSTARDWVDIWTVGTDMNFGKRSLLTLYYSLSAGKGLVDSFPLGDPTIAAGPNKFLLTTTNAAVPYPETVNRAHEVAAVFKFKINKNVWPKFEYHYQQWDNRDYQTTPMTPYMGCVSALPPSAATPGCPAPVLGAPSPIYPFFVVGDPSAQRFLFLGADQPSYHVHWASATLEYRF
jgi:MtrB/PioB family decaheme-associated outer membrane protein